MRGQPGDHVELFDGSGREYDAVVQSVTRSRIVLDIAATREPPSSLRPELVLAVALPKGDRQKWLVEKLTELGVARCIPLYAVRQDIKYDENVRLRLQRHVLEASKQSGRCRLMEIDPEMRREEIPRYLDSLSRNEQPCSTAWILAHPLSDGQVGQISCREYIDRLATRGVPDRIVCAVGPAGGFAPEEVKSAVDEGWTPLDLGSQVYRVETAAIVVSAIFSHLN